MRTSNDKDKRSNTERRTGSMPVAGGRSTDTQTPPPSGSQAIFDPVCGMPVDTIGDDVQRTDRHGVSYYFCSPACKAKFEARPQDYAA